MQQSFDPDITKKVLCKYCRQPTPMDGTQMCDRCFELERRIRNDPEMAVAIMAFTTGFIPVYIPEVYVKLLARWASVSRTLIESSRLLEKYANQLDQQVADVPLKYSSDSRRAEVTAQLKTLVESVDHNRQELEDLTIPLDSIHISWRSKQWQRERFLIDQEKNKC